MAKRKTTEQFIAEAKTVHDDKYDYSQVEYINTKTKVKIICSKHGMFEQAPDSHLSGQGCPKCAQIKRNANNKLTTEKFIEKSRKVHGDKYDYHFVNYVNNHTDVCIICPIHGEFWQRPEHHMNGSGCPICAGKKHKTNAQYEQEARAVHGNKYDYSLVDYKGSDKLVTIICPEHGPFSQRANSHLQGNGCPKCAGKNRTTEEFIKLANKKHNNFYDYSKTEYTTKRNIIKIICPIHGKFEQVAGEHLRGHGCPECGKEKIATKEAIEKAHQTRKQNETYGKSQEEENLYERLKEKFDEQNIERQYCQDKRYPFACDFYIKSLDLFIEYNGYYMHSDHWFDKNNPEDVKKANAWLNATNPQSDAAYKTWTERDVLKRQTAAKNNLNYVVLWNENDIEEWFDDGCPVRQDWK